MALTKVNRGGLNTGISDSSDATFLTATSSEGVTLAGTLAVTGVHTVGNNAIHTSDGGAVTQNLVQGLAKSFLAYKGTSTNAIYDSNNIASVTDVATGKQTPNFTNNFNSANNYATTGFGQEDTGGGGRVVCGISSPATSNRPINTVNISNAVKDLAWLNLSFHGDLA
jgi:hypothetical protein